MHDYNSSCMGLNRFEDCETCTGKVEIPWARRASWAPKDVIIEMSESPGNIYGLPLYSRATIRELCVTGPKSGSKFFFSVGYWNFPMQTPRNLSTVFGAYRIAFMQF